jgi:hypothetical protein
MIPRAVRQQVSPMGHGTNYHYAGEDQQQISSQSASVLLSSDVGTL